MRVIIILFLLAFTFEVKAEYSENVMDDTQNLQTQINNTTGQTNLQNNLQTNVANKLTPMPPQASSDTNYIPNKVNNLRENVINSIHK
jgi:hypothetical protein